MAFSNHCIFTSLLLAQTVQTTTYVSFFLSGRKNCKGCPGHGQPSVREKMELDSFQTFFMRWTRSISIFPIMLPSVGPNKTHSCIMFLLLLLCSFPCSSSSLSSYRRVHWPIVGELFKHRNFILLTDCINLHLRCECQAIRCRLCESPSCSLLQVCAVTYFFISRFVLFICIHHLCLWFGAI